MISGSASAQREVQIHKVVGVLEARAARLESVVSEIEGRLASVTRDSPPDCNKDIPPREMLVPLATSIQKQCDNIDTQIARIEDIISRLEL